MQKKVNYHVHSWHSDGKNSVEEIVNHFQAQEVTHFALTDHDTIDGVLEAQKLAAKIGMTSYTGIEMTACFDAINKEYCHILGLDFDLEKMEEIMDDYYRGARGFDLYSISYTTPEKAIETIHKAHGIAILAHPYDIIRLPEKVSRDEEKAHELIKMMLDCGIDGIEVFYRNFSKEKILKLNAWADEYKLIKSIGSDYHGKANDSAYFDQDLDIYKEARSIHEILINRN